MEPTACTQDRSILGHINIHNLDGTCLSQGALHQMTPHCSRHAMIAIFFFLPTPWLHPWPMYTNTLHSAHTLKVQWFQEMQDRGRWNRQRDRLIEGLLPGGSLSPLKPSSNRLSKQNAISYLRQWHTTIPIVVDL